MSEDEKKIEVYVSDLAKAIIEGTATEEQRGIALQCIQITLATAMVSGVKQVTAPIDSLRNLQERLADYVSQQMIVKIDDQSMAPEKALEHLIEISDMQVKILELERKIIQGRDLMPSGLLSDDEKLVMKLLKSFSTKSEKQKFLALVQQQLAESNGEEASE